jgi:hydroxypyruvate reductase
MEVADRDRLARSPAHETALACLTAGVEAAHPERVLRDAVARSGDQLRVADAVYDLADYDEVLVLGG